MRQLRISWSRIVAILLIAQAIPYLAFPSSLLRDVDPDQLDTRMLSVVLLQMLVGSAFLILAVFVWLRKNWARWTAVSFLLLGGAVSAFAAIVTPDGYPPVPWVEWPAGLAVIFQTAVQCAVLLHPDVAKEFLPRSRKSEPTM
jgi:hypothetical protein